MLPNTPCPANGWVCCAGHGCTHNHAPMAIAPFVIRWGPEASSDMLRQSARCSKCGAKGATLMLPSWVSTTARRSRSALNARRQNEVFQLSNELSALNLGDIMQFLFQHRPKFGNDETRPDLASSNARSKVDYRSMHTNNAGVPTMFTARYRVVRSLLGATRHRRLVLHPPSCQSRKRCESI
jgi:hypothetical protein